MGAAAKKSGRLARFASEDVTTNYGEAHDLPWNHPAVIEGRTLFPSTVVPPASGSVLVSGANNPKIGKRVEKGPWAGFPIFTLTLEERATCPRSCHHWRTCYGSGMHLARRHEAGPALEDLLDDDLALLQRRHPEGFLVRLHVLGDFYSTDYVTRWRGWIARFPALHVFGYSAWPPATPIGAAVRALATERWDRFAVRLSVPLPVNGHREAVTYWGAWPPPDDASGELDGAILCPGQRHATETCGTCGLCWGTTRNIAFAVHGRKNNGGRKAKAEAASIAEPEQQEEEPPRPAVEPPPEPADPGPDALERELVRLLKTKGPLGMGYIADRLPGYSRPQIRNRLQNLIAAGWITMEGNRRTAVYCWAGNDNDAPDQEQEEQNPAAELPSAAAQAATASPTARGSLLDGEAEGGEEPAAATGEAPATEVDNAPPPAPAPTPQVAPKAKAHVPEDVHPLDPDIRRLWDKGCTLGEIAGGIGRSIAYVSARVKVMELPGWDAPPEPSHLWGEQP